MTHPPRLLTGISLLGWRLIVGGVATIAIIVVLYCVLDLRDSLLVGALGSTIAAIFAGIVVFLLARAGVSLDEALDQGEAARMMAVDPAHDDVDWGRIIERHTNLDIVVAYYDNWAAKHSDNLRGLFVRGGRIRILMPNPDDQALLERLSATFFLDRTPEQLRKRIVDTGSILARLKKDSGSETARLEVRQLSLLPLYAMVVADDRRLYLSTFEQFRDTGVNVSVFDLRLSNSTALGRYWLGRRERFFHASQTVEVKGDIDLPN